MIKLFNTQSFWCSQELELPTIPLRLQWMAPHLSFIGCPPSRWLVIQEGPQTLMNRLIRFKQLHLWGFLHWVLYDYLITSNWLLSIFWLPNRDRDMLRSRQASQWSFAGKSLPNFNWTNTTLTYKMDFWWKKRPKLARFFGGKNLDISICKICV